MAFQIEMGSLRYTPEDLEAIFKDERDQRRPTPETPGGFSSSSAFTGLYQRFRDFKDTYVRGIETKLDKQQTISRAEIENVKALQRVSLAGEYDYKGDHYKSRLRILESGGEGGNHPRWKILEMRAEHAGLLEGGRPREVRIQPQHAI